MSPLPTLCLHQLAAGERATVTGVISASAEIDAVALRRLGELGFLPGERVQLLRRGPGGREPLEPPVLEHPVVQEILVRRGQLVLELRIEVDDDLRVAFHGTGCRPDGPLQEQL